MKILIRHEKFNDEYVADVFITKENVIYISSNSLASLFHEIFKITYDNLENVVRNME